MNHPDLVAASNNPILKASAEEKMVMINIAKEILLNPQKRKEYNQKLGISNCNGNELVRQSILYQSFNDVFEVDWEYSSTFKNRKKNIVHDNNPIFDDYKEHNNYSMPQIPPPIMKTPQTPNINCVWVFYFCPRCGTRNLNRAPICLKCNLILIVPMFPSHVPYVQPNHYPKENYPFYKQRSRVCPRCHTKNSAYTSFCYLCHESLVLTNEPTDNYQNNGNNGEKNKGPIDNNVIECPKCGQDNQITRSFCFSCYSNLLYPPLPQPRNQTFSPHIPITKSVLPNNIKIPQWFTRKCPNCGFENLLSQEFCRKCQTNLTHYQLPRIPEGHPNRPNTSQGWFRINKEPNRKIKHRAIDYVECPNCGKKNPIGSEICNSCYKNLIFGKESFGISRHFNPETKDIEITDGLSERCPICNHYVKLTQLMCFNCGTSITRTFES